MTSLDVRLLGLVVALLILQAQVAHAQQAEATDVNKITSLEEILVTARKREESLHDVPISITAIAGDTLRENGIGRLEYLAPAVPNFHISEAVSGSDQFFMRGIGSGVNFGFEMAIGQVIDGFFYGRSRYGRAAFLDIERVEVLRGPQGALLGKNTSAGAINITTAKPTDEFEAWIAPMYEFEADEGYSVEGVISGPLADTFRARVALRYDDRDGWVDNQAAGDEQSVEDFTGRLTLVWDPTEDVDVTLQYQRGDYTRDGRTRQLALCAQPMLNFLAANNTTEDCTTNYKRNVLGPRNGVGDFQRFELDFDTVGLTVDWELGNFTLASLTGFAQYDALDLFNSDLTTVEAVNIDGTDEWEQWSQELRVTSPGGERFEWLAGLYLLHSEQDTGLEIHFVAVPPPIRATRVILTDQESDTWALFGQVTWNINDQWSATVGGRYTDEDKEASQVQFPAELYTRNPTFVPAGPAAGMHNISQDRSESNFSPTFDLQWRPNEDMMFYGSVRRGFKGGGFDHQMARPDQASAEADFQFEDEDVTAFEIGGKLFLAEGRAELNAAIFRSKFDDLQVSTLQPALTFNVGNAASAITQGVELEGRWRPVENLTLFASAAYLDATFDDYPNAPCYFGQTASEGCVNGAQDLSDEELQFAPDWTFTVNGDYVWSLPNNLELIAFLQAYYMDEYALALDLDPNLFQDDYVKIDARLTLANADRRWELSVIGRNLNDETTSNFGNDASGAQAAGSYMRFVEAPRSIAVRGVWRF